MKVLVEADDIGNYIPFKGRKFRGYECPAQGTEVRIDYYTTYIMPGGDERVTSIQFMGGKNGFGDLFLP